MIDHNNFSWKDRKYQRQLELGLLPVIIINHKGSVSEK